MASSQCRAAAFIAMKIENYPLCAAGVDARQHYRRGDERRPVSTARQLTKTLQCHVSLSIGYGGAARVPRLQKIGARPSMRVGDARRPADNVINIIPAVPAFALGTNSHTHQAAMMAYDRRPLAPPMSKSSAHDIASGHLEHITASLLLAPSRYSRASLVNLMRVSGAI